MSNNKGLRMKIKKTVFFGPFLGEFGWELLYWQGWVRKMCQTEYKNYDKIVCSFPGRHPLYTEANRFIPLPKEILKLNVSSRAYITDNWINGFPKANENKIKLKEVSPHVNRFIEQMQKNLPIGTMFFSPNKWIKDPLTKKTFGTKIVKEPQKDSDFVTIPPLNSEQSLEQIKPTPEAEKYLNSKVNLNKKLICLFPRCRLTRRPDKNWDKKSYEKLIKLIQKKMPYLQIAILGAPSGAYFSNGVPDGCIDLINIKKEQRMDVQIAALRKAVLALGGESGGLVFSRAIKCPTFCWGHVSYYEGFKKENFMKTKEYFHPNRNPTTKTIVKYVNWIINRNSTPRFILIKSFFWIKIYGVIPKFIKESNRLAKIKKMLLQLFLK
jgi:hypothetical protein